MSSQNLMLSIEERLDQTQMPAGKRKTLLAATQLFASQGFHGTSTAQLAEKAGVSQATIFKYFKTKEDLLADVLTPMVDMVGLPFLQELAQQDSPEELVHFLVRDRFAFIKANQFLVKIVLQELLVNPKSKEFLNEQSRRLLPQIEPILTMTGKTDQIQLTETVRRLVAPLFTYIYQVFVLDIPSSNEEEDLTKIEREILALLSL